MNGRRKLPWIVLFLAALALGLVAGGCGGGDEAEEPAATEEQAGGGGDEAIRVGLVTDIGGLNDRGFNELAYKGLKDAESQLGVEIRALESKSDADYIPNLQTLAEEGYNLVISVGFLMGDATHRAAAAFPDTNFAIVDYAYPEDQALPNLQGLVFKEQETGYLVGYLAGLVTQSGTVSSVGGQKIPPVDRFIAGYEKAVKDANPRAKTLRGYSQDFVAQDKCKEIALDQIANGSDVVFQVAGGCGLGALDAAKERRVWGIGVDKDQAFLGAHVLTSALKRVDVAVFKAIQGAAEGNFEGGGVTIFGLAEDGVGLGKTSPRAPKDAVAKTKAQINKIIDGEVQIPEEVK